MKQNPQLLSELMFTKDLKSLVSSYEQISAMRLQVIRDRVLTTRRFSSNVSSVVGDIRINYRRELEELQEQGKLKQLLNFALSKKSKPQVSVLISPNVRFTGQIVPRQFNFFINAVKSTSAKIVVVGRVGKQMIEQTALRRNGARFTYFDLPDHPAIDDLKPLITFLLQYQKVDIYHNKFNSLMSQDVVKSDITGEKLLFSSESEKASDSSRKFLFEPKVREILTFLETQLLALFLKQTIHESDLANLGSRVTAMEGATRNIDKKLSQLKYQKIIQKRLIRNRQQRQMLAGMRLWGVR